ncbi:alpha/beta fold hydrolase [Streptomyces kronopolitis]|uniref:alpha/beta fold hydrolase n=1 Tax=Streptomyces kronopolitis TaxID=1612435 RepID=UPI0020BED80C|nr:alpha/beta fold hydrolase [Streptomyces kronopolitis]MCL6302929.1 alpha/beta fold hydrolase [Streptomyces kronopolitis]
MNKFRRIASAALKPQPLSRGTAIGAGERLAAATTLTSSLEYLTQRHQTRSGGLNDWSIVKDAYADSTPLTRRLLDAVSGKRTTTALHVARAMVSAGMLLPGNSRWRGVGSVFLGGSTALLYPRHRYGTDGSDQVSILVQTAMGIARVSTHPQTKDAALWYVALQANLSYLVSGWVKLLGPDWRDATALGGVLRTKTYGHEPSFKLTQRSPRGARFVTYGVLALECLFPIAYLGKGALVRPIITCAAAFHTANGFVMGLGRFVSSFVAMHPAIAYTAVPRSHSTVADRDDRALAVALGTVGATAVAAGLVALQRRLHAGEGWPTSRRTTTRCGNVLQYEVMSDGEHNEPVLVFCHGLGTTSEHFAWITEAIARHSSYGIVTYARAGYAGSMRRSTDAYQLSESVEDLLDLIDSVIATDRKVVLVGHSLGGELCRRAAELLGTRVQGVVYLDTSHPAELTRSAQQSESARHLRESITAMTWSLRLGAGLLMSHPDWFESLPQGYRSRAFAQYCTPNTWATARREWAAMEREFRAFSGDLPSIAADALVISAEQTVSRDPEQLLMHRELAQAHEGAGRQAELIQVEDADHQGLIVEARHGLRVASRIIGFLDATVVGKNGSGSPTPADRSTESFGGRAV